MSYVRGSQSVMVRVFVQDNSLTTGKGLTGLTSASTNLQITTQRELDTAVTIYTGANIEEQTTVGTYQAPSSSAKIRFKAVDDTNDPGTYELQFHNSAAGAFGTGDASRYMQIRVDEITTTALKIAPCKKEIMLTADDPQVNKITAGSGAGQLNVASGKAPATIAAGDIANNAITANSIASAAISAAKFAADAVDATALATSAVVEISSGLLNTVNTGASFNIANSVGRQIRQGGGGAPTSVLSGTVQTGSTANTIKLSAAASATNNAYVGNIVTLDGGTPAGALGQTRTIIAYNGTTKVATVDSNWIVTPTSSTTFSVYASANAITANEGTAQGGGPSSITLATTASGVDSYYANNSFVTILSGTGAGQTKTITAYNGTSKVATVDSAWSVEPFTDSVYAVIPFGATSPAAIGTSAPSAAENASTLLATAVTGRDLSAVTAPTVQDSLAAAAAQGAGSWLLTGTTLTLKNLDGTTFRVFTLDSATVPTQRV